MARRWNGRSWVLVGAALLAAAGLASTGRFLEVVFSIVGLELTLAGFVIAGVLAIRSADHHGRPSITASLDETGRTVKAEVSVGTLESRSRVVTLVEGVVEDDEGAIARRRSSGDRTWDRTTRVTSTSTSARLPAGRYDSVRIAAWTVDEEVAKEADDQSPTEDAMSRAS